MNLSPDPHMSELLVYYLKAVTCVGRSGGPEPQDIQLSGAGIQQLHCVLKIRETKLVVKALPGARTCVNGAEVEGEVALHHGDRLLWGSGHFFRVSCPSSPGAGPGESYDWSRANEEVMMAEAGNSGMDNIIARLEKKYREEKHSALELQRQEYEQQLQGIMGEDEEEGGGEAVRDWLARQGGGAGEEQWSASLMELRAGLAKAAGQVREANTLCGEVGGGTSYALTLQIPAQLLCPGQRRGFLQEPSVLVSRRGAGRQVWSMDHLETRLRGMREVVEEARGDEGTGRLKNDPFFDSVESHTLIGVASVYLSCLLSDGVFEYSAPVLSQDGRLAGKLLVELRRVSGAFPQDRIGQTNGIPASSSSSTHTSQEEPVQPVTVRLQVKHLNTVPLIATLGR